MGETQKRSAAKEVKNEKQATHAHSPSPSPRNRETEID